MVTRPRPYVATLIVVLALLWSVLAEHTFAQTPPPIPELAQVRVYADTAVAADPWISFHAGSHRHSVRVDREAWQRAAGIRYGRIAAPRR
jgi:hypothetical protein